MIAQAAAGFVLWIVFSGGGLQLDPRPYRQYQDITACLKMAERYQTDEEIMKTVKRLREEFNMGTTLLCLPTGMRP